MLVVDDDEVLLSAVSRLVRNAGLEVHGAGNGKSALEKVRARTSEFDVVLVDVNLPDISGLTIVERLHEECPSLPAILMSGDLERVSDKGGGVRAYDVLPKPFAPQLLLGAVERALERRQLVLRNSFLETKVPVHDRHPLLVGRSAAFARALSVIDTVGPTDSAVLVLGESGTGKELVARTLHARSARRSRPFLVLDCGAFTGANAPRQGIFEQASGGTLFLDDIGELSVSMQVHVLRVLQEQHVRVVAATRRDLESAVRQGTFREDLYHRLNVVALKLPPLRERRDDIPSLARHFVDKHAARVGRTPPALSAELVDVLCRQEWPGNVRELENAIEACLVLAENDELRPEHFPEALRATKSAEPVAAGTFDSPFNEALSWFQRAYFSHQLRAAEGNISEVARRSGLDRSNLRRLLRRHGLLPWRREDASD